MSTSEIKVLKLNLHDKLVGYLAGFNNRRNVLSFADEFKNDPLRQAPLKVCCIFGIRSISLNQV